MKKLQQNELGKLIQKFWNQNNNQKGKVNRRPLLRKGELI